MVALIEKLDNFPKTALRARGATSPASAPVQLRSNSLSRIEFRVYTYGDRRRLESCSRDPIGYRGGTSNLFESFDSTPHNSNDPLGLKATVVIKKVGKRRTTPKGYSCDSYDIYHEQTGAKALIEVCWKFEGCPDPSADITYSIIEDNAVKDHLEIFYDVAEPNNFQPNIKPGIVKTCTASPCKCKHGRTPYGEFYKCKVELGLLVSSTKAWYGYYSDEIVRTKSQQSYLSVDERQEFDCCECRDLCEG